VTEPAGENASLPPRGATKPLRWQQAPISQIIPRTAGVKSFFLAPATPFPFVPGQHVDLRLTAEDGYQAERSYSIASAPAVATAFELAIERLADGEVSPFFHDVAAVGDEIEFRGPIGGHFVWSAQEGGPILLIGGGSGVVPLMSMLRHRAASASEAPLALLYSAPTWDDLIFRDELLALHGRHDGFELKIALTREATPREGVYSRRVDTAMIDELLTKLPNAPMQTFICGSNPFVEAAAQGAIRAGIAARSIRTERYGG